MIIRDNRNEESFNNFYEKEYPMTTQTWQKNFTITDPPVALALFSKTRWAWLWLIVRLYVGYTWLTSGWGKLSNPAWVQTGKL